jgi:hypothetical protein
VDPVEPDSHDRLAKLRNQQDRQALVNLLVRQVTSLLQRTKLHVAVKCQAIHAKNSRHMLLGDSCVSLIIISNTNQGIL